MFNSKREAVEKFITGKDWVSLDEITLGCDMSRTKTKQGLYQLKAKGRVERRGEEEVYRHIPPKPKPEPAPEPKKESDDINISLSIPRIVGKKQEQEQYIPPVDESDNLKFAEPDQAIQHQGLNAKVLEIDKKLDMILGVKDKKEKKAKLKRFSIRKLKQYNKKNKRAVIMMGRDKSLRLIKGEAVMGMIRVGENYYDGSAEYTWLWMGKQPILIIPEWSVRPLTTQEVYETSVKEKTLIDSQVITIRAAKMIELDKEDAKKGKMNWLVIVGIIIAAIIIIWVFFGGKKGAA